MNISRVPYNNLIKKLNICNIPLSESEEYDIWWILLMYSLLRVSLYIISSDPSCKDGNARFTIVALKALSDKVWIRCECL